MSWKEIKARVDNPEAPLKKALEKVCEWDQNSKKYRMKEYLL